MSHTTKTTHSTDSKPKAMPRVNPRNRRSDNNDYDDKNDERSSNHTWYSPNSDRDMNTNWRSGNQSGRSPLAKDDNNSDHHPRHNNNNNTGYSYRSRHRSPRSSVPHRRPPFGDFKQAKTLNAKFTVLREARRTKDTPKPEDEDGYMRDLAHAASEVKVFVTRSPEPKRSEDDSFEGEEHELNVARGPGRRQRARERPHKRQDLEIVEDIPLTAPTKEQQQEPSSEESEKRFQDESKHKPRRRRNNSRRGRQRRHQPQERQMNDTVGATSTQEPLPETSKDNNTDNTNNKHSSGAAGEPNTASFESKQNGAVEEEGNMEQRQARSQRKQRRHNKSSHFNNRGQGRRGRVVGVEYVRKSTTQTSQAVVAGDAKNQWTAVLSTRWANIWVKKTK